MHPTKFVEAKNVIKTRKKENHPILPKTVPIFRKSLVGLGA
jgi:hypothetical protein